MNLDVFKKRFRINFGKFSNNVLIPNLVKIQIKSYEDFLQFSTPLKDRKNQGLEKILKKLINTKNTSGTIELKYNNYKFEEPKYTPEESMQRGVNYSAPLKINMDILLRII